MINLTRTQVALLLVPLLVLLTVAGSELAGVGASEGPSQAMPLTRVESDATAGAGSAPKLVVHVVGAVRRPGLFRVTEGSRIADALSRAGGPTKRADLTAVNLAAPLVDGQQVVVPVHLPAGVAPPAGTSPPGGKVSLGLATLEELDELPGIGPVTAQKIVDWRTSHGPFRTVEDLDDVPGIGPARIEQLRELVTP